MSDYERQKIEDYAAIHGIPQQDKVAGSGMRTQLSHTAIRGGSLSGPAQLTGPGVLHMLADMAQKLNEIEKMTCTLSYELAGGANVASEKEVPQLSPITLFDKMGATILGSVEMLNRIEREMARALMAVKA